MPRPTTGAAYLTLILTILGGVVFTVFVTIPAYSTWRGEYLRLAASRARQEEKQVFLENIDARTAELKQLDRDVRALQIMFPENIAIPELQAIMQSLASRNGVAITEITRLRARKAPREEESQRASAATRAAAKLDAVSESGAAGNVETPPSPPPKERSESVPYEFGISLLGSYAQVRAFMSDLERSLRFFDLPGVALSVERGDKSVAGTVAAQLNVWTYLSTDEP